MYSLGVLVADVSLKFLNAPGKVRRSVPEVDRDWANGVVKGRVVRGVPSSLLLTLHASFITGTQCLTHA